MSRFIQFAKKAGERILWGGGTLQVGSYLLGVEEETYALIIANRELVVIGVLVYTFIYWMVFDAELSRQQLKYNQRLKGASLRLPRKGKK